jgi:3-hydroxyisobutyrate dehydrogenase-like beta-hydroxyacid dehydrogenase
MPGDMGHAVGRALREHGHDVVTCLAGRGPHSHALAKQGGLRAVATLADVAIQAEMILSILPPAAALQQAQNIAAAMQAERRQPIYVDCTAISPQTAKSVGEVIAGAGAPFIDAGIIGAPPGRGAGPRIYVSGADVTAMLALDGQGFLVKQAGANIGDASALKMAYAGLTKGTRTLHTAVLMAAQKLGVAETLFEEFEYSQKGALEAMRANVPFLPADSERWVGEMEEIARTFAGVGVPSGFHDGAAEIFRLLARTPFASETRADMDRSRTLEAALAEYVKVLPG